MYSYLQRNFGITDLAENSAQERDCTVSINSNKYQ